MTDDTKASDLEVVGGKLCRRKDGGKDHPRLLGDAFRRDEHGEIRFDGKTPSQARGSLLQNSKTLVASGQVLDGNTSVEAEAMSNELREQSARTPIWDSDLQRKAIGLPIPTPEVSTPRKVPVNMLFPEGPKRGDGIAETSRARARREQRTPRWDNDATSATTSPIHGDAIDARAKAQTDARTPIFDAGPDAPVAGIG